MRPRSDLRLSPRRPSIPPLLVCGMSLWLASACAYERCIALNPETCRHAALVSFAFAVLALAFVVAAIRNVYGFAVCALALGVCLACTQAASVKDIGYKLDGSKIDSGEIVLVSDASRGTFGQTAASIVQTGSGRSIKAIAVLPNDANYYCGQRLNVSGNIEFADWLKDSRAWRNATACRLTIRSIEIEEDRSPLGVLFGLRRQALEGIGSDDAAYALIQALSCGNKEFLKESDAYSAYQTCGLAHLVAVSGAHLVIVTSLVASLFKSVRVPRKIALFILITLMAAYVVLAGMPLSAIRAAIMSSVGILALLGKRRPSSLNALGMGLIAILCASPESSVSVSLALSALSTLGIVLFSPIISRIIESLLPFRARPLLDPLALTVSASMLSQLYACSLFSQLPLVSCLANAACAPLFPLCCSMGILSALFTAFQLPFSRFVVALAHAACSALNLIVKLIWSIPYASVPVSIEPRFALVVTCALCALLWLMWERLLDKRCLIAVVCCSFAPVVALSITVPSDAITMLDVGQGDSFLIQSHGLRMLVDTGNQDSKLLEQLGRCRVSHLDAVLITHADDDHCGSLDALSRAVEVDKVLVAQDMLTCDDSACKQLVVNAKKLSACVEGVERGDEIQMGGFTFTVLWPDSFEEQGGNADSVIFRASYDAEQDGHEDFSALFTGDAEMPQLDELAKGNVNLDVDLLKVGHHGSRNAMTKTQLELISPRIALIGVGKNNRYGHPADGIISMLDNAQCLVFRSDADGTVAIEMSSSGVKARKVSQLGMQFVFAELE